MRRRLALPLVLTLTSLLIGQGVCKCPFARPASQGDAAGVQSDLGSTSGGARRFLFQDGHDHDHDHGSSSGASSSGNATSGEPIKCQAGCKVMVAGKERSYCLCKPVGRGDPITVYWDPPSVSRSGGLDVAFASEGSGAGEWVGLGFPQVPGKMEGADAVVVRRDGGAENGASTGQFYLGGYSADDVAPTNNLPIDDIAASADGGTGALACAFTLRAEGNAASLPGLAQLSVIAAGGPLKKEKEGGDGGSDGGSELAMHRWDSSAELQLQGGAAAEKAATAAAAAAKAAGGGAGGEDHSAHAGHGGGVDHSQHTDEEHEAWLAAQEEEAAAAAAAGAAPAPAPAGGKGEGGVDHSQHNALEHVTYLEGKASASAVAGSSSSSSTSSCFVGIEGQPQQTFERCAAINGQLSWYWDPPANGSTTVKGALRSQGAGWGSVAFAEKPDNMIGASAVVVADDPSQPSGAYVGGYYLAGYDASDVQPPAKFSFVGTPQAGKDKDGALVATFEIDVKALNIDLAADGGLPLIYAQGPLASSSRRRLFQSAPQLGEHDVYGGLQLDMSAASAPGAATVSTTSGSSKQTLYKIHGWFMAIAYGILFPIGIGIARNMKKWAPAWFYIHVAVMLTGYLLGLAGWIIGWVAAGTNTQYGLHKGLGIAVFALFTLQLSALLYRPKHVSRFRRAWNVCHWWVGRIGLGLAVWNIYEGITNVYPGLTACGTAGYTIGFSVALAAIVGGFFMLETVRYARLPPPGTLKHDPEGVPADAAGRYTGVLPDEANAQRGNGAVGAGGAGGLHKRVAAATAGVKGAPGQFVVDEGSSPSSGTNGSAPNLGTA